MTQPTYPLPVADKASTDEQKYASYLIDIAADMIVSVDAQRRIKLFNKAAEAVYGYTAAEMIGQSITLLYGNREEYTQVGRLLQAHGRYTGEITGLRKNGEHFPVLITATLLHDTSGNVVGSVGYSRDLTAEKKAAAMEREYIAMLGEEKLKKEVEHITRHDMKSPLNSIIGFADLLLEDEELPATYKETVRIIYNAGIKALRMVNLSLDLLKIERGEYPLDAKEIQLIPIFVDMQLDNATLLKVRRIPVSYRIAGNSYTIEQLQRANPPLLVQGEEIMCYNIFANLFKNAVEAAPADSQITIRIDYVLNSTCVAIAMNNAGVVPTGIRDRFFEKYATSGKIGGTGLGTYSAKRLTETLGGQIQMTTNAEEGTTLTVWLPCQPGATITAAS
ncbi:MAG: PAS domain S-box protein [Magnetococcales bacterium]|nr:PAS domain S-box protein [Magnetococcales bacterium]